MPSVWKLRFDLDIVFRFPRFFKPFYVRDIFVLVESLDKLSLR